MPSTTTFPHASIAPPHFDRSVACSVVVSLFEGPDRATQRKSISTSSGQACRTFSTVVLCPQQQVSTGLWSSTCRQRQRQTTTRAQEPLSLGRAVGQRCSSPRPGWRRCETDGGETRRGVACNRSRHRCSLATPAPCLAVARLPRRQAC